MKLTIDQEIHHHLSLLNEDKKRSLLQLLKTFSGTENQPLERITIEQYNRELEEAERQIEAGYFTTQEDLEKEMQKW